MTSLLIALLVVQSLALGGLTAWTIVIFRLAKRTELHADHIRGSVHEIAMKVSQIRLHTAPGRFSVEED